jgi:mono/diheme cytochrome c family protein
MRRFRPDPIANRTIGKRANVCRAATAQVAKDRVTSRPGWVAAVLVGLSATFSISAAETSAKAGTQPTAQTPTQQASATREEALQLDPGPGHDLAATRCAICHSVDYIQMNAPVMTSARWQATVRKMIDKYGAPIDDDDAKAIIEYLSAHYTEAQ